MRQLHVLGVSDDGTTLLLGTSSDATKPSHRIPLDDRLRAAIRGQLAPAGTDRVESALPPREIQARLRAGDSAEAVAKAAGVPVARVLPYAAPVLAERDRIVDEARGHAVHRRRGPQSTKPLGELVDAHLDEVSGLKPDTVDWTARRRADGAWIVSVSYAARGGTREASWLWQPAEHELTPLDAAASRLAIDASAKRPSVRRPAAKKVSRDRPAKPAPRSRAKTAKAAAKPTKAAAKPAPSPAKRESAAAPAKSTEQSAAARAAGGRVPLPSWSDVLLGVQTPPSRTAARRRRPSRRSKDG